MVTLKAPAKINLFLAIRNKGVDGYHEIETVLARVPNFADTIEIEPAEIFSVDFISEKGNNVREIDLMNNTVVKAVHLLEEKSARPLRYRIVVRKKIPPCSGLGGGASDAASVLLYLNEAEKLGLSNAELRAIGAKIGMDVPFFVSGYAVALGVHYGEQIEPLRNLPKNLKIKIEIHSDLKKESTAKAYALWDKESFEPAPSLKMFLAHLKEGDSAGLLATLHNDFERLFDESRGFGLSVNGLSACHLCGSGGAQFYATLSGQAIDHLQDLARFD